ncbi:TolC family protein [Belliella kenyensis]|uniref:TolC family protein n=1 Tax=Belliella kenyensis TaxID=1472724 RepID=A0ABV8EHF0_9BACT|nr:TolC family protein [Belliella kenyensis]MCH7400970.1 TolC family protein [Belliella kenyensis]MDN3603968.1 TolC family protein [Belliella kenyensis]
MRNKYTLKLLLSFFLLSQGIRAQESMYDALDLQTCIEIALENNLTLKRSEINLALNEATLLQSQGQRLPSLSAGGITGYRWGRSINPVTNLFENNRIGNVNISASTNFTLFAGQQITNTINQAKSDIEVSKLNVKTTENNITLNVINLFINVIFSEEQLKIARNQMASTKEQLENTTKLVDAGSLPLANKLDLQAQNATNELEVLNAENSLRGAKLNLLQAMQLPFDPHLKVLAPDLSVETVALSGESVDEIYELSKEILPQIKAAQLAVESAEYGIKIARGAFYPTLGIGADVFTNYVDVNPLLRDRDPFVTQLENNLSQAASVRLSIPIFSNFRNTAGLQRARLQRNLSEITAFEVKNELRQDIEVAFTNAIAADQAYRSSLVRVSALDESFRIAKQRFDAGAINFADYQLAQNNLFNAQADLVTAKYTYIFRVKVLDFYLGNPLNL